MLQFRYILNSIVAIQYLRQINGLVTVISVPIPSGHDSAYSVLLLLKTKRFPSPSPKNSPSEILKENTDST